MLLRAGARVGSRLGHREMEAVLVPRRPTGARARHGRLPRAGVHFGVVLAATSP